MSTGGSSPQAASPVLVRYDGVTGLLDVRAAQSAGALLLKAVAEEAGIRIQVGEGVAGDATVAFSGLPLEEGVRRIAEAAGIGNLSMEYAGVPGAKGAAGYRISVIRVFASASAAGGGAHAPVQEAIAPERAARGNAGLNRSAGGQQRPPLAQRRGVRAVGPPGRTGMRLAAPPLERVVADTPGGLATLSAAGRMLREQAAARRPRLGRRLMP